MMLKNLSYFLSKILPKWKLYFSFIVLGAIIAGLLEMTGLLMLFPLITLLIEKNPIESNNFYIKKIYQFMPVDNYINLLIVIGITISIIFVLKNIYLIYFYYKENMFLRELQNNLTDYLMKSYISMPYIHQLNTDPHHINTNIVRLTTGSVQGFIHFLIMLISNLLMALVISLILFYNYFNILVVVGLLLFSISFIQYRILKNRQLSLGKEYADLSNRRSQILYQTFCNLKENKIFHTENFFYKKFTDVNNKFVRNETIRLFYSMLPSYFTEMMLIVSIVVFSATIITGHIDNVANIMSSLAILAGIAFRMAPIINRVLVSLGNINSTKDFVEVLVKEFKRFDEMKFINLEDRKKIIPLSFKHNIIFENISFNYPNKIQPALSNINLEIKKGDFIGIVGKSGAGKTTFVDILLGLLTPTTGNLKVDDVLILEENSANWQANLSYIPQHIYINDDTIERNVAFGLEDKHINRDKVIEALKNADIYDFIIENLPQGIETIVGDQGKKLSGGQKQRIGIARALYHASDLIVLDEATAALDVNTENNITQAINKLKKDKTIIAIAHRLSTLKQADYLLFFDKGRLVDKGNFEYLSKYSEFQRFIKLSKIEQNNE